ncbi:ZIFL2 [Symbiodinium pilosum]|uniref:ZIFL2 protein n=1 Tax=Symbiodinium pilosum TaxID=2952 RepID=A0A812WCX3_SYMPI|nr:ZIFL2 [Symbiodinium pilosum]
MNLIDCINVNLLTPYVDKMVSTFLGKSPQSPEVAHTVGLLIGLYSLFEVICSPFWGMFADFAGRKPCLLIGLAGSAIAPILFGLGQSMPVIFAARALDGFFCGNMGVTRTYLGEIVDETNEAQGFSFLALCFSVGLFLGPILGGELVYPAQWAPSIFGGSVFDDHPFLLPNLTYAIFAAISWCIGATFLEETLPKSQRCIRSRASEPLPVTPVMRRTTSGTDPSGAPRRYVCDEDVNESANSGSADKKCYPMTTIQIMITYCGLSGCVAAQNQLMILLVSYDRSADGFEFGPRDIGIIQNIGAVGLLMSQLLLYPTLTKKLGFLNTFVIGFCLSNLAYGLFPVYGLFADPVAYGSWRYLPLGLCQFFYTAGTGMCYPTAFAFINRASEGLSRGAVNGWANSSGALCRAVFPPAAAVLLGQCNRLGPYGRYIPFYVMTVIAVLSFAVSWSGLRKIDQTSVRTVTSQPAGCADEEDCRRSRREPLMES